MNCMSFFNTGLTYLSQALFVKIIKFLSSNNMLVGNFLRISG